MLNPTAFFAGINILHFLTLGEARTSKIQAKTSECWGHVGTFFALGRVFFALGRFLGTFSVLSGHLGRFLGVLELPGIDFLGVRGSLCEVLEAPGTHFSKFFRTSALGLRKRFDPYKTMAGAVKIKACALTLSKKIYRKSHPRAFRTRVPAKNVPKIRLGACQGRFWSGLGVSWARFGRLLAALGRLLAALGRLLSASWALPWISPPLSVLC